jgi:hypothetical protein
MYPANWHRCVGCGDHALDGKATCGKPACMAAALGPRQPSEDAYQHARRLGRSGDSWRDNPYLPGTREWYEFGDGLSGR